MDGFLLPDERAQALEDGVDGTGVRGRIEDRVQVNAAGELTVPTDELAEVLFLVPGAQGVPLDEPVGLVAVEPGLDERQQKSLAEEEAVARLEVAAHPLRPDPEALDQPGAAVEHVVEGEEG